MIVKGKILNRTLTIVFSIVCLFVFPGKVMSSDSAQAFTIKLGQAYFTSMDTTFLADANSGPLSTNIDFSRDLNMEDSKSAFLFEAYYRLSQKHRFDFTYYEVDRDGNRAINREITLGDTTFLVNMDVSSSFSSKTLIGTYSYMFHSHDEIDLGFSAGLHINDVDLRLEATGGSLEESESQLMPLPVVGVVLGYDLSDKLFVNYQSRVFLLNYDDYRGSLRDTRVSLEHHTFQNFGFEFGYNRKSYEVEVREPNLLTKVNHIATGWFVNLVAYF